MSIVCRNLHFAYNGDPILTAVDLEVREGEFCVLLGRNGSGKTTLIYCLAGLLRPQQGTVAIDGLDLAGAARGDIARRVSLVPQENADIFPFRVLEVVVGGLKPVMARYCLLPVRQMQVAPEHVWIRRIEGDGHDRKKSVRF